MGNYSYHRGKFCTVLHENSIGHPLWDREDFKAKNKQGLPSFNSFSPSYYPSSLEKFMG